MNKSASKNILVSIFKQVDKLNIKISALNSSIRDSIGMFDDEDESMDPVVQELVKLKGIYLEQYRFLTDTAKDIAENIHLKPVAVNCLYFVERFKDSQKALDYINHKLDNTILLEGTKDLFTGLGCTNCMYSYSPERLYYVEYRMPLLFKDVNIILTFEDPENEYEYISWIDTFICSGLKKNVQESLELARAGTMCSFNYYNALSRAYSYLKDNFKADYEIEKMLQELQELNSELFKSSPLLVYGRDEEIFEDE